MIHGRERATLYFVAVFSLLVFSLSIFDILMLEGGWREWSFILYGVLVLVLSATLVSACRYRQISKYPMFDLQKALRGGLYHFQCSGCGGLFAVKRSRLDSRRSFRLTCPSCGMVGRTRPGIYEDIASIPIDKSQRVDFFCVECGEHLSLWAEGYGSIDGARVLSCPYCGRDGSMELY